MLFGGRGLWVRRGFAGGTEGVEEVLGGRGWVRIVRVCCGDLGVGWRRSLKGVCSVGAVEGISFEESG